MEKKNLAVSQEEGFKAALYLRLSKEDGDREESDSIQNQRMDGQIGARRTEIARCETLVASLYESWQSGVITKDEFLSMKTRYNTLREDAEQAILSLSREIGDIIACGGEKSGWIAHFQQYHDFTGLTRRMVVTLIDILTVHPGSRLDVLFRYRYDYERAVSFAKAVCQMHIVPGAEGVA